MTQTRVIAVSDRGYPIGDDCPRTIHPDSVVRAIMDEYAEGKGTLKAIAAKHGVPYETARTYVSGRRRSILPCAWVAISADGRRRQVG